LFGIKTPEYVKEKIIDIIKTYPDPKPSKTLNETR
jgi:hypothetical protein